MPRTCHLCGTSVPDRAEFCPECGVSCDDASGADRARRRRGLALVIVSCVVVIVCSALVGCLWYFKIGLFAPTERVVVRLDKIPDEAFRAYLAENVDADDTGDITEDEVASAVAFGAADEPDEKGNGLCDLGIVDLTGIEYFTSLETLVCSGNEIATLDLSNNTLLREIVCNDSALEELTPPATDELRTVHVTGNPGLGKVDFTECPSLDDVLLDETTRVVGVAPADDFDPVPVEDLALVYCTADGTPSEGSLGLVGPSGPGEDADFDFLLIFLMVYNKQFGDRASLGFGTNAYGLDYEDEGGVHLVIPDETVRQIITSFYGSCPDDLSYLSDSGLEPVRGGWRMGAADGQFTRIIETRDWQTFGSYVSFVAEVTYVDGIADHVVATYQVTARRNAESIFGYSLCARPGRTAIEVLEGTGTEPELEPEPAPEEIDYYAYAVERLDAAGKIPDGYIVEVDSETADALRLHVYVDMGTHVATGGWYELDKNTLVITDTIFGGTI